ncbi:hypothetical protein SNOG_06840 [Parastagonospora nodorum SN15]|uniref:Uncharacterized protein n=1 Tax=Phaeosphaeria nodorum (strain SN15 / ATCC MYA-4574 / FGSC 10173) TaxID=321614 RepID=Q0UN24_PHANO|nr:hypothetical protein SNOG_06840 [Parastagonospora nodorum SN15]EAT85491.1 hypothetical protein SNOG_06840 [Parastagonospora nodorum SN15]
MSADFHNAKMKKNHEQAQIDIAHSWSLSQKKVAECGASPCEGHLNHVY